MIAYMAVVVLTLTGLTLVLIKHKGGNVFYGKGTAHDYVGFCVVLGCLIQAGMGLISRCTFKLQRRVFPEYMHIYMGRYVVFCKLIVTLADSYLFWDW